jgi:hypothetical protein
MEKVEQLKSAINENVKNVVAEQISEKAQALETRLDEMEIKLQKQNSKEMEVKSFEASFAELVAKNFDSISDVSAGNKVKLNMKKNNKSLLDKIIAIFTDVEKLTRIVYILRIIRFFLKK